MHLRGVIQITYLQFTQRGGKICFIFKLAPLNMKSHPAVKLQVCIPYLFRNKVQTDKKLCVLLYKITLSNLHECVVFIMRRNNLEKGFTSYRNK